MIIESFYDNFIRLCANSCNSIKLCSPYVKNNVIDNILSVKRVNTNINLITKVSLKNFHSKTSDVEALGKVLSVGGSVYNCSNLHAKVYMFDDKWCAITSANLTDSGLKRNIECGVMVDDDLSVSKIINFFEIIQNRTDVGQLTDKIISEIQRLLEKIPPIAPIKYPQLNIDEASDKNLLTIANTLTGWKRHVFLSLGQFGEEFTTNEVVIIAEKLQLYYPNNNFREAKVRQILQQLRDLGLIEFVRPGLYKKLWT